MPQNIAISSSDGEHVVIVAVPGDLLALIPAAGRFTCANPPVLDAPETRGVWTAAQQAAGQYRINFPNGSPKQLIPTGFGPAFNSVTAQRVDANNWDIFCFDAAGAAQDVGSLIFTCIDY